VFHPLNRDQIAKIVDLQLQRLEKLLAEKEIRLEVTEATRKAIATEGYDPTFGARPLKRVIQNRLQNKLATEILRGRIAERGGVRIDYQGDEFTFAALPPAAASAATRHGENGSATKVETVAIR
jgi:ATP-dependent Clp protease ATP-binding subunit ClpB